MEDSPAAGNLELSLWGHVHEELMSKTPKGNSNYQSIWTQLQCTQFHQTYSEGPKSIYRL
jgi:hypothetical protein